MKKIIVSILLSITIILTGTIRCLAAWHVDIEFSTPSLNSDSGVASNKLSLGTDLAATSGYDNTLDTIALLNGPIHAYLIHSEYNQDYQRLWRDFRNESLPQEWEIEVATSSVDQPVKVTWQINAPQNLSFNLINTESNQDIVMSSVTEYSYSSTDTTTKRFLLKVSENTNADTNNQDSSVNGGGSSKGGGCGYIKSGGDKNNNINKNGQVVLNMIITMIPVLLSLQYRIKRHAYAAWKILNNRR